jgi:hypothetical protein
LWAVLRGFVEKEAWATTIYSQMSNPVGGLGCSGAATGSRKTETEKKIANLKSLSSDYNKIRQYDYLCRLISLLHKKL